MLQESRPKRPGLCIVEGCELHASFGPPGIKRCWWCKNHSPPDAVNHKVKRCTHQECDVVASYGRIVPVRCRKHRLSGHINVVRIRCDTHGCDRTATYGLRGGRPERCIAPGCRTIASYGWAHTKRRLHCHRHRELGDVNLVNRTCEVDGCQVQPSYGPQGQRALRCRRHHQPTDVSFRHHCKAEGCTTTPQYGPPNGRPVHCKRHSEPGELNIRVIRTYERLHGRLDAYSP